jgi:chemotaxis protein methyltransferase CheR
MPDPADAEREPIEITLLLEGIYQYYGFDFRDYAKASLRRRLWRRVNAEGLHNISGLQERVLHDPGAMERLLVDLSINVTSMFRDPGFFAAFRSQVVPILRPHPFIRVWNAGCSTGEETYSLAILLREVGLYDRSRIYATDMNEAVLHTAAEGIYPLARMKEFTENYLRAGGSRSFSDYYRAAYGGAQLDRSLTENVVFAQHNLVTDRSFNEFHVIVCRNVMIYFDRALQDRVNELFLDSLADKGVLALGRKERVGHTGRVGDYEAIDALERIYRKAG